MRIADALAEAAAKMAAAGIEDAGREARLLLAYALGKSYSQLLLAGQDDMTAAGARAFAPLLARRLGREPFALITGEREFWSLPFFVNKDVLIPRPETEFLLEQALAPSPRPPGLICDLCCGSGAIAVVLAKELQQPVLAVDISRKALAVTQINARRHGVAHLVCPVAADLLAAFRSRPLFSLVVTNPPYVSRAELAAGLPPEVALFEPRLALDGGADGLEIIARIRQELAIFLLPGGEVFMEIGYSQGAAARAIFERQIPGLRDFSLVRILPDYADWDRVLRARLA